MSHAVLDTLITAIRSNLPPGITEAYLDGFVDRHRATLLAILDEALGAPTTTKDRTEANLVAMALAANPPRHLTAVHKRTLSRYTGWGGLSIRKVANRFPADFPTPDPAGLVHEYYTPAKVTDAVVDALEPLLPGLGTGRLTALEPSAGIGRFLHSADRPSFAQVDWHVVERSPLSARMLAAMRPDLDVFEGPFERWVAENPDLAGRIDLVLANPPYGPRGGSITDEPDRSYREKQAWAYFLRRCLDLLAPGGLGVFLIPAGFLTGTSVRIRNLRDKVLLRHHLAAAYRLLSGLFPGAHLVTDLLFFRARGGALSQLDPADHGIVDGRYFEEFPEHVLGEEVGRERGGTDQTKKPRWGYQVVGEFTGLPPLVSIREEIETFRPPDQIEHSDPKVRALAGRDIQTRPDGVSDTHIVDVKHVDEGSVLYDSDQLRLQRLMAEHSGRSQGIVMRTKPGVDPGKWPRPSKPLAEKVGDVFLRADEGYYQWTVSRRSKKGSWERVPDEAVVSALGGTL